MFTSRSLQSRRSSRSIHSIQQAVTEVLESRQLLAVAVGGGWTNAGLTGTYYNSTNLTAPSSFTRKDVRIDFDWGSTVKPGGSIAPGYRDIGTDNYSIQWTGQLVARFAETYTFKATADESFMLELKPAGSGTWTTVINQTTVGTGTGTYAMTAGGKYDVRITYKEFTGSAAAKLTWSSPSTPEEVIDPVTQAGINNPDFASGYTDIVKGARNRWEGVDGNPAPAMDSNGWPRGNAQYVFQESLNQGQDTDPLMRGKVTFSFDGQATVSIQGNVNGSSLNYSYDSVAKRTTGSFTVINNGWNASSIFFRSATRPDGTAGIANLKMMRPTAPDATTSYAGDTTFTPQIRDAMSHFTVVRHQYVANQQKEWSDRTTPTWFNQSGGTRTNPYYGAGETSDNGASWEYKIMLANETGRDLMISLPPVASDNYVLNLARLIRYGSDANGTPYTTATANPAFPPLNPNLRVYFEIGNELWNWAGVFWTDWQNINELMKADVQANNTNFQQFNYDNLPTTITNGSYDSQGTWRFRKIVQRTMQESDIFRSVFGDAAMPNSGNTNARIRPFYGWQYANDNDTARLGLAWAERYYNNADGVAHVATPRPLNYWLWGGSGAAYYGAINGNGLTDMPSNNSFDATTVANGYNVNPSGTGFTFTGTAGIARDAGTGDDIPTPRTGSQVGYITDTGTISFNFTVPSSQTSNVYAFAFKAVNRTKSGAPAADKENIRVFLDDTIDITAKTFSQGNGYTPPGYQTGENAWKANNVFWTWSEYYYTKSANLTAGTTHKITIKGMGDISNPSNTNQTVFIDDVRITSVDKIFADGIPGGGEATGQPAGQNIQNTMNTEANWAKAFGLEHLAYESGWSLGGDDGGSYVQLKAKYGDARTANAQKTFMDYFSRSGSSVNVFGTYAQWPSWSDFYAEQGLLNVGSYPIVQGIDDRQNNLAAEPTNGILSPAVLKPVTANITDNANSNSGQISKAGGFLNWTVVVPKTGTYTLSLSTTGTGGTAAILANGIQIASGATGGSAISGTVTLTKGNHSIRVLSKSGTTFNTTQLSIAGQSAPASPTLNTATDGDGSATLGWSSVSGATGYVVRYDSTAGNYSNRIDVGNVTSYTLSGLTNNQQVFFAIDAYNASGESLPSNERGVIPLADGQTGSLVVFEFAGYSGGESSAIGSSSSRTPAGTLTRGSGWRASDSSWAADMRANRFASENGSYGATLAAAITNNQYYQFTITPASGKKMSLASLAYRAYFQDAAAGAGTGITYSTDGTNFSSGITATGSAANTPGTPWNVNLSGIAALQNTTSAVTIRIYQYGMGGYSMVALGDGSGSDIVMTGSFANSGTVTAPAAPTNLAANATSSSQINLTWTDNATDETGYVLERATDSGFSQNYVSTTLGANTTSSSATGLTANTTYYFRLKAIKTGAPDSASITANATTQPVQTLRDPENPANTVAGLDRKRYTGTWSALPNFDSLTPATTDTSTNFAITTGVDNFGYVFTGYVNVPADGTYTFYTTSDDGSALYIGSTQVVNNDGLHGAVEASGQIGLKAGKHALKVTFFEAGGGEVLEVRWSSASITKQLIPDANLFRVNPIVTGTITREVWTGVGGTAIADIPVGTTPTTTDTITSMEIPADVLDSYGVRLRGYLVPSTSGSYTFWLASDDAGELWLSPDNTAANKQRVAYHTSWTSSREWGKFTTQKSAAISLTAGQKYYIEALMKEGNGGDNLAVSWKLNDTVTPANGDGSFIIPGANLSPWDGTTITSPAAPSGLSATATSSSQINLAWTDNSSDETGFTIDRASDAAFSQNVTTATVGAGVTSYSATGLSASTAYYFRVKATKTGAPDSAWSASANATTQGTTPVGPTGYTYVANEGQSYNFGTQVVDVAYGANGSFNYLTGRTGTVTFDNATFGDPIPGVQKYGFYKVATVTAPAAPSNLAATAASYSQINLSWTDNAGDETGFTIDRATDSAFSQNLVSATVGSNITSYSATGLAEGTTYYFRVKATKTGAPDSAWSTSANAATPLAAPGAPSALSATAASSTQINLAWTDNATNETGFTITRATDAAFTLNVVTSTVGANVTTFSATGLTANTTYYFRVKATRTSAPDSAWSSSANATTPAVTYGIFTAVNDIGGATPAGSTTFASGTYTVKGGGADIWGTSDQFHYANKSVSGDQTFIARVDTVQNTNGWAKAGVMFRASTAANSMYAAVELTPSNGVSFQWRTTNGGSAASSTVTGKTVPHWVRIVRSGNTFTASYSANGTSWTQIGTPQTIAMGTSYTAGLAVTSHAQGTLCTSTFSNVSLTAPVTSTTLGFTSATPGSYTGAYTESGFTLQENLNDGYTIVGSAEGYASNAYHPANWAHVTTLAKVGGGTFSMTSFKYASGRFSDAGDIVVTGYKSDNTTVTTTVNFSSKTFATATVNWTDLTRVEFNFANGTNGVYGAIDDIIVQ